jgi:hypothetical protein
MTFATALFYSCSTLALGIVIGVLNWIGIICMMSRDKSNQWMISAVVIPFALINFISVNMVLWGLVSSFALFVAMALRLSQLS